MLRFVLIFVLALAAIYLALKIFREIGKADVDWRGIGLGVGFVALAMYLSHATGIGGVG